MLAFFLDTWSPVKVKKKKTNLKPKHTHKNRQTPRYSFLSICFIWQSSNSDSSHSIYWSSSNLLHFNLSSSPRSFYFRTIAPSWRGFHLPIPKCYSGILLSEYLDYHQPLQWNGCTNPNSLGPWSLTPPEVVLPKKLSLSLSFITSSKLG